MIKLPMTAAGYSALKNELKHRFARKPQTEVQQRASGNFPMSTLLAEESAHQVRS
jgi:hypothetical protein